MSFRIANAHFHWCFFQKLQISLKTFIRPAPASCCWMILKIEDRVDIDLGLEIGVFQVKRFAVKLGNTGHILLNKSPMELA